MPSPVVYLSTIPDSGARVHGIAVRLLRWIERAAIFGAGWAAGAYWWSGAWL